MSSKVNLVLTLQGLLNTEEEHGCGNLHTLFNLLNILVHVFLRSLIGSITNLLTMLRSLYTTRKRNTVMGTLISIHL